MIRYVLIFLCLCLSIQAETTSFHLKNGLQVIVSQDTRSPIVVADIWYKVGSADERPTKSGIAHFLEHMMFQGTENTGPGKFRVELSRLGSHTNAETDYDTTHYTSIVPKENLDALLAIEADRMENLKIYPTIFDKEKNVVLQERLNRMEDNAAGMAFEQINKHFFNIHPYATPVIGWRHEIDALTENDLMYFYKTWYAPNNAILVLVGDISLQEARVLTEKHFGSIMPRKIPKRHRQQQPKARFGTQTLTFKHPQFGNDVEHIYRVDHLKLTFRNKLILKLVSQLMQDRLHEYLTNIQNATYSVTSSVNTNLKDPYSFTISASIKHTGSKDRVNNLIAGFIASLKQTGFEASDLKEQKKMVLNTYYTGMSSLENRSQFLGNQATLGVLTKTIVDLPKILESITLEEVNTMMRTLFQFNTAFIGEYLYGEHAL